MGLLKKCFLIVLAFNLSSSLVWAISFPKGVIKFGEKVVSVELATTNEQMQRGLMGRKSLHKDSGMLFIFNDEQVRYFWMKDTIIDLSIAYIDKNGVVVDIQEMKSTKADDMNPPSYPSQQPAQYALEMTKGWFKKNGIKLGSKMTRVK